MYGNDPNTALVIASKVTTGKGLPVKLSMFDQPCSMGLSWRRSTLVDIGNTDISFGNSNAAIVVLTSNYSPGPTSATVSGIKSAISALGNSALNTLVSDLKAITHDNARSGLPTPTCTTMNCLTNVDSYSGTCK